MIKSFREFNIINEANRFDPLDHHYIADALDAEGDDAQYGPDRTDDLKTVAEEIRANLGPGDIGLDDVIVLIERNEHLYTDSLDVIDLVEEVWTAL